MSWNINFRLAHDEDGNAVLTLRHEFGAPDGEYIVTGHTMQNEDDWGEAVGVTTPIGYVAASIPNPKKRG